MNVKEIVSEHTKDKAREIMTHIRGSARPGLPLEAGAVEFEHVSDLAHAIWYEVRSLDLDTVALAQARDADEMVAAHAINRAALAMRMAKDLELDQRLMDLGISGLVCDLGMFTISPDLLERKGKLEAHEKQDVQDHISRTIAGLSAGRSWNAFIKTAVAHHHEREDGSGYPKGLTGSQIHPLGRVLGIADVFSAMVQQRPYRDAWVPHEALEYLVSAAGFEFNGQVVKVLYNMIPPYPVGSAVKLSSGEKGIVVKVPGHLKHRPKIRITHDATGARLEQEREIDLTRREYQSLIIVTAGQGG